MNAVFWLSLVMASAGCLGLVLAGKGMWQGWAIGLAVQPVWAAFAILTKGYGLLITCLMYGTVYGKNLIKWRREQSKPKEEPLKVIFAGNRSQADEWFRHNKAPNHVVASSRQKLEGLRFTRDDVVFVGNYYERPDFLEIMELIDRYSTRYRRLDERP